MMNKKMKIATRFILIAYIVIFSTATDKTINRVGLIATACFGGLYFLINGGKIKTNNFLICMILYGALVTIARLYSISPGPVVSPVFIGYISMLIVIFVAISVTDDEKDIDYLLKAFSLATVVQCIYMLSVYGTDIVNVIAESEKAVRIGGEVSNSNSVGISFAIGYIVSLHYVLKEKTSFLEKIFHIIVCIIGFVFGLLSGSRKVLLLLLMGSFLLLVFQNDRKKNVLKTFFWFLVGCGTLYFMYNFISTNPLFNTIMQRFTSLTDGIKGEVTLDHSAELRFFMIKTGWEAFLESPIYGKGLYASYKYFATYSHNNFIEILMNTGIIGFVIFYFPFLSGIKNFIKIKKSDKKYALMFILILWAFFGGIGMVNYYSKDVMTLMSIVSVWLVLQRGKKNEEIN